MKNLRKLRQEHKLTLLEVSKQIGIGESTLSLYESGKRQPDFSTLIKIADFFNVTIDYLLEHATKNESNVNFDERQIELLSRISSLNDAGKRRLEQYLDDLLSSEKYKLSTKKGVVTA